MAQLYYYKGKFVDSAGQPIAFVKMKPSKGTLQFEAGSSGEFGIPANLRSDSVVCYINGYDTTTVFLMHDYYNTIVMQVSRQKIDAHHREMRLNSLLMRDKAGVKTTREDYEYQPGESYNELLENPMVATTAFPLNGFVPNNNQASYSNIRRFTDNGNRVPPNAVRIEELWNYFQLKIAPEPEPGEAFTMATQLAPCPWNPANKLLMLNAVAGKLETENLPPANLVFLIDNSGSMEPANRLPLLKAAFKMLVNNLRPVDRIAIVTYGGAAGIMLPPTFGGEKQKILDALDMIEAGGVTPGSNGIQLAYELATTNAFANGVNKVILATDGDFNVGIVAEKDLEDLVSRYRYSGVTLSCLGVGMGNYKDSKIEVLARIGNGNFAYLDTEEEAQKVLVHELTKNLYAVATDVNFHVQFDPSMVSKYRLIGYDNRVEALSHSGDRLFGTDVGSGQSIVAMFELVPTPANMNLRSSLGSWEVSYRLGKDTSELKRLRYAIDAQAVPMDSTQNDFILASSLAWYSLQLRDAGDKRFQDFSGPDSLARKAVMFGMPLHDGYLKLLQKTRALYEPQGEMRKEKKGWLRKN